MRALSTAMVCGMLVVSAQTHGAEPAPQRPAGAVDADRMKASASDPDNWLTSGRDQEGTYYSPLTRINSRNVSKLGFAWQYDLGTFRGQEATPIVVDGVMYTSGTWGYVYAVDAATGKQIWRYDPGARHLAARHPCCDLVNRGVAVWKGRVYVASVDGRLHALDAATGQKIWEADTIANHKLPYSSTGAPEIAGNLVVIGNSGGDMSYGGVRGYVSAYDLATGAFKWRVYTVPPEPGSRYETPEIAAADRTWDSPRDPKFKGGGTAWDGFAYDPALDLVYFGTGNAAPYDPRQVGPSNLDELYTASILAVHADSGQLAWHYQTTPHDRWDFDSVQKLVMADLPIDGKSRQTIMQASKNGFFYVLDRKSGELLSATSYTYVNWASGVDPKTGRPTVTPQGDWYSEPKNVYPSWAGGHTWNPMSYSLKTHLMYIPVLDVPSVWVDMVGNGGTVKYIDGFFTVNGIFPDDTYSADDLRKMFGPMPDLKSLASMRKGKLVRELLRAWDPVAGKTVWERETSSGIRGYDGGVMSTASNLVFQGRGSGELWVYAADSGKVLKTIQTGSHIMAAPMTYIVKGEQFVALQTGYGGAAISVGSIPPSSAALKYQNVNRIIAFKLGGPAVPTPAARIEAAFEKPPAQSASAQSIQSGETLFVQECSRCHVFGPSVTPDLRKIAPVLSASAFKDIVLRGAVAPTGMERFDDVLTEEDADNIRAYLIDQAGKAYTQQASPQR
jgi:quinohemoprotein ethanol dehydrogenase